MQEDVEFSSVNGEEPWVQEAVEDITKGRL